MGSRGALRRSGRRDVALTWIATGVLLAAVYAAVVLLGRLLTGEPTERWLAILATGAVAAVIDPAHRGSQRLVARVLHGSSRTPYDVLARFAAQVDGGDASNQLPSRMARLLAEGTGAEWAQVWLLLDGEPTLVAGHPPTAPADTSPPRLVDPGGGFDGTRSVTVAHQGELLGVLRLKQRPDHPLTPVEERLFAGLAAQAGVALHAAKMRAQLEQRHQELVTRAAELRSARTRLVTAQDEARRNLERDIHDGAQQQLVALGINLRLAQTLSTRDPARARELVRQQVAAAEDALDTLTTLARGDRPRLLRERGLVAALEAVAATSPLPVELALADVGRLTPEVESALYFCALESLQNSVKHAHACSAEVRLSVESGVARLSVLDDGQGVTADDVPGAGRANMRDRLAPLGGHVGVLRRPEGGTEVCVVVPVPVVAGVAR